MKLVLDDVPAEHWSTAVRVARGCLTDARPGYLCGVRCDGGLMLGVYVTRAGVMHVREIRN